jgi:predicted ATPase/class 3 adenylate cyclase/DNA-binding CsgD family transcriptional regulator
MKTIPSGTVTFLFTDIEGSTGLWERYPEQMQVAFQRQEVILRETVEQHGGYAYKMIGDAFQVAFETAPAAICAALEAQRQLHAESWGDTPIRVRMALHTGVTEERGDDYVGPALNRVGRLICAGYGGQVLLTQATCELVWDDLPCGASLRDLGEHRFKDLVRVEHIYQLEAPDLPSDFPPIKTLEAFPHNLPVQLTSFIGREMEMMDIRLLLLVDKARLVTLTGSGGTGKTRLALQAAADLLEAYKDGVWLVELSQLADPALIPQSVAAAVGIREAAGKAITNVLIEYLRSRRLLLILDNCEHLVEASAYLVNSLLQFCPDLQILATSREILGVAGEVPFRVPSLSIPDIRQMPSQEQLAEYEAVRLFVERAAQASPTFLLTATNAPVIARICSRLDGIPLAIELAAARVRLLSVDQIAARLADSFRLLTGGSRTVLPRHQTLKALIDWSYNLLSPPERTLLVTLSVFAGGWTLEAAEEVCGRHDQIEVFPLLAQLVDKSLVMAVQEGRSETRYRLLETIRQYTREKSIETGGGEEVHDRHLDYFLKLARQAEPHLRGKDQAVWFDRLDIELDNLRQALEWSLFVRLQDGLQLGAALLWFWHIRGHGTEGIDWLNQLLEAELQARAGQAGGPDQRQIRAKALHAVGFLSNMQNEVVKSKVYLTESLEIFRELGAAGQQGLAGVLLNLAAVTEDEQQVQVMYQESLALSRQLGDKFTLAEGLQNLGGLMMQQGKFDEAGVIIEEDLALRRQINDLDGMGTALIELGEIAFFQGKPAEAEQYFADSLECFRKVGNKHFVSRSLFSQAMVAFSAGDFELASRKYEQAIAIGQELREDSIVAVGLFRLARVSWTQGKYDLASHRYQEVLKIAQEIGIKPLLAWAHFGLAMLAVSQANYAEAKSHLEECSSMWREIKDIWDVGLSLLILVELAYNWGQFKTAAQLFGAAERLIPPFVMKILSPPEIQNLEHIRFAVQDVLGKKSFEQSWLAGQELTLEQALDLFITLGSQINQKPAGSPLENAGTAYRSVPAYLPDTETLVEPLSDRELEVLRLIASGSTNLEIARKLYIDIGTVKSHNTHIFAKLNVKNRTQAVSRARRMGLI